jgi:hypothetical protein
MLHSGSHSDAAKDLLLDPEDDGPITIRNVGNQLLNDAA